jgi:hypothetical protein
MLRIILLALFLSGCATTFAGTTSNVSQAPTAAPLLTSELLDQLVELLSQNPDLRKAYLAIAPDNSGYFLVPSFDGSPNMTSLYEAVELFKQAEPSVPLTLALLTPGDLKRNFAQAEPIYVRP